MLDEVAAGESLHLLLVDRRMVGEIEGLQGFDERKAGHGGAHRYVLTGLGSDFLGEDLVEKVAVGHLVGVVPGGTTCSLNACGAA